MNIFVQCKRIIIDRSILGTVLTIGLGYDYYVDNKNTLKYLNNDKKLRLRQTT